MNDIESETSFCNRERVDATYRKIVSESAYERLLARPNLSFRMLVTFGFLAFFFVSAGIILGIMIWQGRMLWVPLVGLMVLLGMVFAGSFILAHRFMQRIDRLIDCTQRIAKGDFTPVLPNSKYRDEFTNVNIAINQMLDELDTYCAAMMESHQLTAIGTLTAGVAHELNNPLNNIMLTAHTLMEEYKDLPETERIEMMDDLIQETERAQNIVRNLQDFARESESASEQLNVADLIQETEKLAVNQAKVSGVTLDVYVQPHLPVIHGDRQQWKQVFLSLILNALDAVEKDGKVSVRVEKAKTLGFLNVHVEDNGRGIPAHLLPYVFNPFYTTKSPGKGTGMGLSVSKGIVTRHGGRIDVKSQEGVYTCFTVTIPTTTIDSAECRLGVGSVSNRWDKKEG